MVPDIVKVSSQVQSENLLKLSILINRGKKRIIVVSVNISYSNGIYCEP